jgi:hypothetical protein
MKCRTLLLLEAIAVATAAAIAPPLFANEATPDLVGWATNGPAVCAVIRSPATNQTPDTVAYVTNFTFDHYVPDSLSHFVWTNVTAHTNGRSTLLWGERSHPADWPTNAPTLSWNRDNLLWGMKGMTGLSPCWEGEGNSGQVPITALTRRHGYTRGHGMGPDGVQTNWAGQKVWFVTAENQRVEAIIARTIVRTIRGDYTLFLFREDLPPGIEPLRVVALTNVLARYPVCVGAPRPVFQTEQAGHVNAGIEGFIVNAWKGGDSGAPDMLPLANELVFYGGRSTASPSPVMQADMDTLCRMEGLDPRGYQLQWADLSRFPAYPIR